MIFFKNCIFQREKKSQLFEEWHHFTFFHISLMFGFTNDSWILISAFESNLLLYVALIEVPEENLASHTHMVTNRNSISWPSQITVDIFLYNSHQNSSSSLRVSCNMESKVLSINFSSVTLESTDLSCTLNGFLSMHDYKTLHIGFLEKTKKLFELCRSY